MSLSRKIRTKPAGGAAAPAPAGDSDITWGGAFNTLHFDGDKIAPNFTPPADVLHWDGDAMSPNFKPFDTLHWDGDAFTAIVNASETKGDTAHWDGDHLKGSVIISSVRRTGTPDNDLMGDAWIDENAVGAPAPNSINHGNEHPLTIGGALLAATTQAAHYKWDLTRFANFSAPSGGVMTVRLWGDASTVSVAETVRFRFSQTAASPFTESTINGSNNPGVGGDAVTKTLTALLRVDPLTVEYRMYEMTFTPAQYGPWLGKWLMCYVDSDVLLATPFNFASRENAGANGAQNPYISFDFERN